ncbi:MAG: hypothetical protein E4H20_04865 [Spirochaetales bacterium]|nr:MAG: hypothetical protein E4H20_04865 [Spirochaetales bacterium]
MFIGKNRFLACAVAAVALLALSCVSSPGVDNGVSNDQPAGTLPPASAGAAGGQVSSSPETDAGIDALVDKARAAIDSNHLSEGIRYYVAAMGRASKAGRRSLVDSITGTLNEISPRLSLEPHESWIGPDGTQRTGDVRAASRGQGTMPAVFLYESYGYAKSPIGDATIRFEFVRNGGTLTPSVSTDAQGLANTTISSIDSTGEEASVRAYPVFSAEGYNFAFKTVFRDFGYAPPLRVAVVAGLERLPSGYSDNPRVLDAVAASLKPFGVDVKPYNGVVAPERFMSAFAGQAAGLVSLSDGKQPGYFALVYVEVATPTQMVFQGKVYNIYIAVCKVTLRVVRADGTIVFSEAIDGIKGQGGTEQAGIDDALVKARETLAAALDKRTNQLRTSFEN